MRFCIHFFLVHSVVRDVEHIYLAFFGDNYTSGYILCFERASMEALQESCYSGRNGATAFVKYQRARDAINSDDTDCRLLGLMAVQRLYIIVIAFRLCLGGFETSEDLGAQILGCTSCQVLRVWQQAQAQDPGHRVFTFYFGLCLVYPTSFHCLLSKDELPASEMHTWYVHAVYSQFQ